MSNNDFVGDYPVQIKNIKNCKYPEHYIYHWSWFVSVTFYITVPAKEILSSAVLTRHFLLYKYFLKYDFPFV